MNRLRCCRTISLSTSGRFEGERNLDVVKSPTKIQALREFMSLSIDLLGIFSSFSND